MDAGVRNIRWSFSFQRREERKAAEPNSAGPGIFREWETEALGLRMRVPGSSWGQLETWLLGDTLFPSVLVCSQATAFSL